jgi:hypothetical protein
MYAANNILHNILRSPGLWKLNYVKHTQPAAAAVLPSQKRGIISAFFAAGGKSLSLYKEFPDAGLVWRQAGFRFFKKPEALRKLAGRRKPPEPRIKTSSAPARAADPQCNPELPKEFLKQRN